MAQAARIESPHLKHNVTGRRSLASLGPARRVWPVSLSPTTRIGREMRGTASGIREDGLSGKYCHASVAMLW